MSGDSGREAGVECPEHADEQVRMNDETIKAAGGFHASSEPLFLFRSEAKRIAWRPPRSIYPSSFLKNSIVRFHASAASSSS